MPFETTRWSLVLAAGGNDPQAAREALSSLCQTYWYPLYAYLRRRGLDPDELARASAIVAPQIQELAAESANLGANIPAGGEALRSFVANGFASIPVLFSIVCGVISVLAVPGGLVTRGLRHAVVRRDGREIGRARSAIRFLVAWSPVLVWIGCVGVPMFGEPRVSPDVALVVGSLAFLLMAAGAAWAIASPGRGPHDRIAGTVGCAKVENDLNIGVWHRSPDVRGCGPPDAGGGTGPSTARTGEPQGSRGAEPPTSRTSNCVETV